MAVASLAVAQRESKIRECLSAIEEVYRECVRERETERETEREGVKVRSESA